MKREVAFNTLLATIVEFANEQDKSKIRKLFFKVYRQAVRLHIHLYYEVSFTEVGLINMLVISQDKPEHRNELQELAEANHSEARKTFEQIINGKTNSFSNVSIYSPPFGLEDVNELSLSLDKNSRGEMITQLINLLIFFLGYTRVSQCLGCTNFILIKGNSQKKTCRSACRQRAYQSTLTEAEKEKQRERRRDLYRKKAGGKNGS